jgi:hypothetical protein
MENRDLILLLRSIVTFLMVSRLHQTPYASDHKVLKHLQPVYGLKQASATFKEKLTSFFKSKGSKL